MSRPVELISLQTSPFSVKARLVLTYHGIPFACWEYTPIIGETWMKAKAGKIFSRERVTAPVLLKPDGNIYDSFEIAKWADDNSKRPEAARLFPSGMLDRIRRWNDASSEITSYGRKLFLAAALENEEARLSLVPPALLSLPFGRNIGLFISGRLLKGMQSKYDDLDSQVTKEKVLEHVSQLRKQLKENGGEFLLGTLSYADLTMAVTVAAVCPPGQPRKQPAARTSVPFPSQELYDACKDLQPWADNILDKHFT